MGNYDFDNTNCVYTGMVRGARFDNENWPLEADGAWLGYEGHVDCTMNNLLGNKFFWQSVSKQLPPYVPPGG